LKFHFFGVDVVEWPSAFYIRLRDCFWSVSMVWVQIPRRKNTNLTTQKNIMLTLFSLISDVYIIYSFYQVSQVTSGSSGTYILCGCHLPRCLYNVHYFLWLENEFFVILCNILTTYRVRFLSNYNIKYTSHAVVSFCWLSILDSHFM
jgi:hypothetical protein